MTMFQFLVAFVAFVATTLALVALIALCALALTNWVNSALFPTPPEEGKDDIS